MVGSQGDLDLRRLARVGNFLILSVFRGLASPLAISSGYRAMHGIRNLFQAHKETECKWRATKWKRGF